MQTTLYLPTLYAIPAGLSSQPCGVFFVVYTLNSSSSYAGIGQILLSTIISR